MKKLLVVVVAGLAIAVGSAVALAGHATGHRTGTTGTHLTAKGAKAKAGVKHARHAKKKMTRKTTRAKTGRTHAKPVTIVS